MDDQQLLQHIADGDEQALVALYQQYANLVFSVALHVLHDHATAEEVLQDVFMTIWHRATTYRAERGTVTTWVLTIARRRAIDYYRRQASRPTTIPAIDVEEFGNQRPPIAAMHLDLQQAMSNLPIEQRRCIDLVYFNGLTQHETATQLDLPLGTVKSRIRLAMERLRQALGESTATQ